MSSSLSLTLADRGFLCAVAALINSGNAAGAYFDQDPNSRSNSAAAGTAIQLDEAQTEV